MASHHRSSRPSGVDARSLARSIAKPVGIVIFLGALAYLVVQPLIRLQSKAFADGAEGYRTAFTRTGIGDTIGTTIELALGSLIIAFVLGTFLAWCATRLPPRLRISGHPGSAHRGARHRQCRRVGVPALAPAGLPERCAAQPALVVESGRRPDRHLHAPWIVIITGIGLTSFVYLFVSAGFENISSEHLEAAQIAGSSPWAVFFRVTLPLLRPTLIYGGGIALLFGLGQFTAPLLLGSTAGVNVITTDIYRDMSQVPVQYGSAAALGSTLLIFGVVVVMMQKMLLGNQRRFVTHGGKAFRPPGRPSSWRRSPSSLTRRLRPCSRWGR